MRQDILGTIIFDGDQAQKGYALNRMCFSFNSAENRAAFLKDEDEPLRVVRKIYIHNSFMPIAVRVVTEGDFNSWLSSAEQKYAIDNGTAPNTLAMTAARVIR